MFAYISHVRAIPWLAAAWLVAGCSGEHGLDPVVPVVADEKNDRISITNNEAVLEGRVSYSDESVAIESRTPKGMFSTSQVRAKAGQQPAAAAAPSFTLTLVAEIFPPVVEGQVVQATSVAMVDPDRAVVSYNMRGEQYLGAVDLFTGLTGPKPKLSSEAAFVDSDISAVSVEKDYAYAAEATGAPDLPYPAVIERLKIEKDKFTLKDNRRTPLTSFAGTSAIKVGETVFATSGSEGHLAALQGQTLEPIDSFPLHDARWAAHDKEGKRVVVVQGTPGQISVFSDTDMTLLNTFAFPGADVPESKSTVEVAGGKAFVAAGPEGVQIISLETGKIVGSVPRPDPQSLGLDPSAVVTNAVSVDKDLMFISNGEAGVYVAQASKPFKDTGSEDDQTIVVLGNLRFSDLESVNHVEYKEGYLFVAGGLGGLKIVRVKEGKK